MLTVAFCLCNLRSFFKMLHVNQQPSTSMFWCSFCIISAYIVFHRSLEAIFTCIRFFFLDLNEQYVKRTGYGMFVWNLIRTLKIFFCRETFSESSRLLSNILSLFKLKQLIIWTTYNYNRIVVQEKQNTNTIHTIWLIFEDFFIPN